MDEVEQAVSITESLCLACLTVGNSLVNLSEKMSSTHENNIITYKEAFNVLLNKKVLECNDSLFNICTECVSLLKTSYNFKIQCEASQKLLCKVLGNINYDDTNYLHDCIEILEEPDSINKIHTLEETNLNHFNHKKTDLEFLDNEESSNHACEKQKSQVDLLVKGTTYSLNEVLIVEDEGQEHSEDSFSGFLKNLGTEVSAQYVNKSSYRFQVPRHNEDLSVIIKNIPNEAEAEFVHINENETESIHDNQSVDEPSEWEAEPEIPLLHKCGLCPKVYKKRCALTQHVNRVHKKLHMTPARCDQCGHVASSKHRLKQHQMRHGVRRHACAVCGKRYCTRTELNVHENTHTRHRQYLCSVCGRSFLYHVALQYHMRLHTGERRHVCPYCAKAFVVQSGLTRHLRTHTGDRPYKCKFCGKRFAGMGEYKIHVMGHTGGNVYRCTYCNQGFRISTSLKQHLLGHPGPHTCEMCSKTFIEMNFLRIHMWSTHKDLVDGGSIAPKLDYSPYRMSKSEVTQYVC